MKRLTMGIAALALCLSVTAVSSGAAHASVARNGTYAGTVTVTYVCTDSSNNPCGTFDRTYDITGDCATNTFTGTIEGLPGYSVAGNVTGNTLTYTVYDPTNTAIGSFTATFNPDGSFSGSGADIPPAGTNTYTISSSGLNFTMSCAANHGQYVSSQGGGPTAAHSNIGMPVQSRP